MRRPARLAAAVMEALTDQIVAGKLAAGSALPGEPTLCEWFGVSRIVIREALKSLEQKGLIVIRHGHTTTVADPSNWDVLDHDILDAKVRHDRPSTVVDDLVQVRAVLEAEMASSAAIRRTPQDLSVLARILDDMDEARCSVERYLAQDLAFHAQVMTMAGNEIATGVVNSIHRHARRSSRYSRSDLRGHIDASFREHEGIGAAIEIGDAAAAGRLMREHIEGSWAKRQQT